MNATDVVATAKVRFTDEASAQNARTHGAP